VSFLRIQNLYKTFDRVVAVNRINLEIKEGEFFTLLGSSGCGKTTTLRMVGGLEKPDGGAIYLADRCLVSDAQKLFVKPEKRDMGMVFQSYALWPHMTVYENVSYPLKLRGMKGAEARNKVANVLALVGLSGLEERPAPALSGGQQQRVALARALVKEPDLLLLDEPLSNLDTKLRERMRAELKRLQRELGITTLYVTHDQMEGILLSDRIAVMNGGRILQLGKPDDVYERPDSQFVADFMGSTNLLRGILRKEVGAAALAVVETDFGPLLCSFAAALASGSRVVISVRPENIKITKDGASDENNILEGRVKERTYYLGMVEYAIDVLGFELRVRSAADGQINSNGSVRLKLAADKCVAIAVDKGGQSHEPAATIQE